MMISINIEDLIASAIMAVVTLYSLLGFIL